jgi:hypothetical protein
MAEEAIGAIEVLAKLLGRGTQSDSYTEKVDSWVESMDKKPTTALLEKAQLVISRILSKDSELAEEWQDSSDWQSSMARLSAAIRA